MTPRQHASASAEPSYERPNKLEGRQQCWDASSARAVHSRRITRGTGSECAVSSPTPQNSALTPDRPDRSETSISSPQSHLNSTSLPSCSHRNLSLSLSLSLSQPLPPSPSFLHILPLSASLSTLHAQTSRAHARSRLRELCKAVLSILGARAAGARRRSCHPSLRAKRAAQLMRRLTPI